MNGEAFQSLAVEIRLCAAVVAVRAHDGVPFVIDLDSLEMMLHPVIAGPRNDRCFQAERPSVGEIADYARKNLGCVAEFGLPLRALLDDRCSIESGPKEVF